MFCRNCGMQLDDDGFFCARCGTVVEREPAADGNPLVFEEPSAPVEEPAVQTEPSAPVEEPVVQTEPSAPVEEPAVQTEPSAPVKEPAMQTHVVAPVVLAKDPGKVSGAVGMSLGIAACMFGCLAFSCNPFQSVSFLALLLGIAALVLSIVGMRRSKRVGITNGFALAGLITSAVGLFLFLLFAIFMLFYCLVFVLIIMSDIFSGAPGLVTGPSIPI